MLINALCDYYDVLAREGKLLPEGFSKVKISYLIALNESGHMEDIIDCRHSNPDIAKGKKQPIEMILPLRTQKRAVDSNIIEHRGAYIFGLSYDNKKKDLKVDKKDKIHAFREKNSEFFRSLAYGSDVAKAYYRFITTWNPEEETQNEHLLSIGKDLSTLKFGFCLAGRPDILLHEDALTCKKWMDYYQGKSENDDSDKGQCAILGTEEPIAKIHDTISGFSGGQSSGTVLVCFKESAFTSYGASQSYNSNISSTAMKKYTTALNYLVSNSKHRTIIDDVTFLNWAVDGNEKCDDFLQMLTFGDTKDREKADEALKSIINKSKEAISNVDENEFNSTIDPDVIYYIVGIKPNAARLSVKYLYRQRFGDILSNINQHMTDMCLYPGMHSVPVWKIKKELVSPKSTNDKVDPALLAELMRSVFMGSPYPVSLLSTVIRRVRCDLSIDTRSESFEIRAGLIKACINRKNRFVHKKEEIAMGLDINNHNPAYVCGRLFAVLEGIQQKAANYSLNRTIRDAYFASASVQPATVFPKLISLSQHHLTKLENGYYPDMEIQELMDILGAEFPKTLNLTEQGKFILGYYQQKADTSKKIKAYKENE